MRKYHLSVEIEPPKGSVSFIINRNLLIEKEIRHYANRVDCISITNRSVWGLSPVTTAKKALNLIRKFFSKPADVVLHLTTRSSIHDTYKQVLDAHFIGLSHLLPILGDPRGPQTDGFFANGLELLGFISYLSKGKIEFLSERFEKEWELGQLPEPIPNAKFVVGTVLDPNPHVFVNGVRKEIRKKQLTLTRKKLFRGAEFFISQAIFDADYYFSFLDELDQNIQLAAGVMPARLNLIKRFGLPISQKYEKLLKSQTSRESELAMGNKIAAQVYRDLRERGCQWIHVYSLGNPSNFDEIVKMTE